MEEFLNLNWVYTIYTHLKMFSSMSLKAVHTQFLYKYILTHLIKQFRHQYARQILINFSNYCTVLPSNMTHLHIWNVYSCSAQDKSTLLFNFHIIIFHWDTSEIHWIQYITRQTTSINNSCYLNTSNTTFIFYNWPDLKISASKLFL